jgi:transcriptional/translational regulatory protein YebC/TACO1
VRSALESAGIGFASADVTFLPKPVVELATAEAAKKVLRLIDALDEHDDIQDVYANFDIPDEILQLVDA